MGLDGVRQPGATTTTSVDGTGEAPPATTIDGQSTQPAAGKTALAGDVPAADDGFNFLDVIGGGDDGVSDAASGTVDGSGDFVIDGEAVDTDKDGKPLSKLDRILAKLLGTPSDLPVDPQQALINMQQVADIVAQAQEAQQMAAESAEGENKEDTQQQSKGDKATEELFAKLNTKLTGFLQEKGAKYLAGKHTQLDKADQREYHTTLTQLSRLTNRLANRQLDAKKQEKALLAGDKQNKNFTVTAQKAAKLGEVLGGKTYVASKPAKSDKSEKSAVSDPTNKATADELTAQNEAPKAATNADASTDAQVGKEENFATDADVHVANAAVAELVGSEVAAKRLKESKEDKITDRFPELSAEYADLNDQYATLKSQGKNDEAAQLKRQIKSVESLLDRTSRQACDSLIDGMLYCTGKHALVAFTPGKETGKAEGTTEVAVDKQAPVSRDALAGITRERRITFKGDHEFNENSGKRDSIQSALANNREIVSENELENVRPIADYVVSGEMVA